MKLKLILILLTSLNACLWASTKNIKIELANQQQFLCEIASSVESRSLGLMYRSKLAPNTGMLFVFPHPNAWPFWMKNTKISLDIIWLNQKQQVIYMVENALPCQENCPLYQPQPETKATYVLELAGGQVKAQNIQIGSQLKFLEMLN